MPKEYDEKTDEEKAAEEARKRQRAGVEDAKQNLMGRIRELDANLSSLSSFAHNTARR